MYLALRGLPYSEVKQPVIMPRPDLQAIGVEYRRIPIMAIGKDVYCDTRIIIQKLEELFPNDKLGSMTPEGRALQRLFEIWHTEGPLFFRGVRSMPTKNFTDPAFRKDREQMTGSSWTAEDLERAKPEAHIYMRNLYNMLENLLADDRTWVLKTNRPGLIDIEGTVYFEGVQVVVNADHDASFLAPTVVTWGKGAPREPLFQGHLSKDFCMDRTL